MFFEIHLEENNEIIDNYNSTLYEYKGFTEVIFYFTTKF